MNLKEAYQLLDKTPGGETARMRRRRLLKFLYNERYLTRKGLILRLELALGADCSWWNLSWTAFVLDMWLVRRAFQAAGYRLTYNWVGERRGFYLEGEGELSEELYKQIKGAVDKIDPKQVEITRRLTPAQRVQQGCSITDLAHSVVRYRWEKNWET
jgi:hypothetical protein